MGKCHKNWFSQEIFDINSTEITIIIKIPECQEENPYEEETINNIIVEVCRVDEQMHSHPGHA